MKKILGIMLLGLFLSSNVYAASKYVYLSCPSVININKNEGKYKDSELYKIGSYVGHTFLKFKETKKRTKTTVTVYNQGNTIPPTDPDLWMSFPPIKILKEKFKRTLHHPGRYSFMLVTKDNVMSWIIFKEDKQQWNLSQTIHLQKLGIFLITNSTFDWKNYCETVDKQEFNELIKRGIK